MTLAWLSPAPSLSSQSHVLYAKATLKGEEDVPEAQSTLQKAMDAVRDVYVEEGLVQDGRERVKIHATLLNSRHGMRAAAGPRGMTGARRRGAEVEVGSGIVTGRRSRD